MSNVVHHSRFGASRDEPRPVMKSAFAQHISTGGMYYVFTTGSLRFLFYKYGGKTAPHAVADATLQEISLETSAQIELIYLRNDLEAKYGMDTMIKYSKAELDDVIDKAGITANKVGIVHSGTTSFQVGVYDRATGAVSHLNSFDYGTNYMNPDGFDELVNWMKKAPVQHFVSIGSESYAVPPGKIATNNIRNSFHSELDSTKSAYASARSTMAAVADMGKSYFIPERKAWNIKTSATLALRELYPTGTLLDWGGGQIKNEETGLKVNFSQTSLF